MKSLVDEHRVLRSFPRDRRVLAVTGMVSGLIMPVRIGESTPVAIRKGTVPFLSNENRDSPPLRPGESITVAFGKGTVPFSSNENLGQSPLIPSPVLIHSPTLSGMFVSCIGRRKPHCWGQGSLLCRTILSLCVAWFVLVPVADGRPAQVILIRHAEKPEQGDDLSLKGRERAAALVPYFLETPAVLEHQTPAAIYAQGPSEKHRSKRAVESVNGLARALKLQVKEYHRGDYAKMVEEIMANPNYEGKTVLICWEHNLIPEIAAAFGVTAPPKWPGKAFDRTWIITYKDGRPAFRDLPQKLMYGDSSE
jgi:hypothetical protein